MMLILLLLDYCLLICINKSDLLADVFCVSFLSQQLRSSSVSVVFDVNTSLNDVTPASPILFTVDFSVNEKKK